MAKQLWVWQQMPAGVFPVPDVVDQKSDLFDAGYEEVGADATLLTKWRVVRVTVINNDGYIFLGAAAPSDDTTSALIPADSERSYLVAPGVKVYTKRVSNDGPGSAEVWDAEDGRL